MKRLTSLAICVLILVLLALLAVFAVGELKEILYPRDFENYVTKYSEVYNVPEPLIYAVILAESDFDPNAESHAGAVGLMQLMPDTLDWLSRLLDEEAPTGEISDPETNIKYGTYYLRHLHDRFGSWETAVAAYNAGHGRVGNWLNDSRYTDDGKTLTNIPITETDNYVNTVMENYENYKKIYYNGEN